MPRAEEAKQTPEITHKLEKILEKLIEKTRSPLIDKKTPGRLDALTHFQLQIESKTYKNVGDEAFLAIAEQFLEMDDKREKLERDLQADEMSRIMYAIFMSDAAPRDKKALDEITNSLELVYATFAKAKELEQKQLVLFSDKYINETLAKLATEFKADLDKPSITLATYSTKLEENLQNILDDLKNQAEYLKECKTFEDSSALDTRLNDLRKLSRDTSKPVNTRLQEMDAHFSDYVKALIPKLIDNVRAFHAKLPPDFPQRDIVEQAISILDKLSDPKMDVDLKTKYKQVTDVFWLMDQFQQIHRTTINALESKESKENEEARNKTLLVFPEKMALISNALTKISKMETISIKEIDTQMRKLDRDINEKLELFDYQYIKQIRDLLPDEKSVERKDPEYEFIYGNLQKLRDQAFTKYKNTLSFIHGTSPHAKVEAMCCAERDRFIEFVKLAEALNKVTLAYRKHKGYEKEAKIEKEFKDFILESGNILAQYVNGSPTEKVTAKSFDKLIQRVERNITEKETRAGGPRTILFGTKLGNLIESLVVKPYLRKPLGLGAEVRARREIEGTSSVKSRLFNRVGKKSKNKTVAQPPTPGKKGTGTSTDTE